MPGHRPSRAPTLKMPQSTVLLLPGWQNSGPDHWQSRWESLYGYTRVEQHDWVRPLRGDWISRLEDVILSQPPESSITLVAHSLGCILVAAWSQVSRNTHRVQAALLVAPGDPERDELRPVLPSWSPVAQQRLPFRSMVLGSQDDPYCHIERSRLWAGDWGSEFLDCGRRGYINAESGLGDWPEGHQMLLNLKQKCAA